MYRVLQKFLNTFLRSLKTPKGFFLFYLHLSVTTVCFYTLLNARKHACFKVMECVSGNVLPCCPETPTKLFKINLRVKAHAKGA